MAESTKISWTDHTFNPAIGCTKVSPGCAHCYAETFANNRVGLRVWGPNATRRLTSDANWRNVRKWNRQAGEEGVRRRIFCASLCDVFEEHPIIDGMRPRLWELIRECRNLDWQLLTKRPERIAACIPGDWGDGWPHVWLGASIENADYVNRADHLRGVPAAVRFISYEPALGPIAHCLNLTGIHWLIYGGESGRYHRNEDKQWARDVRDLCAANKVAFFHKQSADRHPGRGEELDGVLHREFPRRVALPVVGELFV